MLNQSPSYCEGREHTGFLSQHSFPGPVRQPTEEDVQKLSCSVGWGHNCKTELPQNTDFDELMYFISLTIPLKNMSDNGKKNSISVLSPDKCLQTLLLLSVTFS